MRSPRGFRASLAWAGALLAALALQQAALAGVVRESCGLIAVAEDGSFIDTDLMGMGVEAYAGGEPATRVNAMCQGQSINLSKRMQKLEGASSGRACVIDTRDGRCGWGRFVVPSCL